MKKFIVFTLVISMILALCACGASASVDIDALAGDLATKVQYDNALSQEEEDILNIYFELPEGTDIVGYTAQAETAESVFAAKCASKNDVSAVVATFEEYVDNAKIEMGKYAPEEVEKLNNVVLETNDVYVVMCITADTDTAESIIGEYFTK